MKRQHGLVQLCINSGVVDLRIETSQSDPLLGLHVRGQDQEFAEELDGAGGGDAGDVGISLETEHTRMR